MPEPVEEEEKIEEKPDDDTEADKELDAEAEKAADNWSSEVVDQMKQLSAKLTECRKALESSTFRSSAIEEAKKRPVRDVKESAKKVKPDARKVAAEEKVQEVLDKNVEGEKGDKNSEWAAGKWMAALTGLTILGPTLMNMFQGVVQLARNKNDSLSDTALTPDLIAKLQAYVRTIQQQSDQDFWKAMAAKVATQSPPPTSADLIFIFQFIALTNPLQSSWAWDSWTDQANLTATVQGKIATDKKGGIEMLGTLTSPSGKAVPRSPAAAIGQNAVALSLIGGGAAK